MQRERQDSVWLERGPEGLVLTDGCLAFCADFSQVAKRLSKSALSKELLVKAAKINARSGQTHWAIDATAGLGEDAYLLAAAGFRVDLYEQDKTIAALLEDALSRALQDESLQGVAGRMTLHQQDSISAMQKLAAQNLSPDVVYLDPMFPGKSKAAATKKKFQLLHHLEAPCANEHSLLQAALALKPQKVVVKRPIKGPFLDGVKPAYSIKGKAIRYDVYTPLSMKSH